MVGVCINVEAIQIGFFPFFGAGKLILFLLVDNEIFPKECSGPAATPRMIEER